jgi:ERCC4-related helicase
MSLDNQETVDETESHGDRHPQRLDEEIEELDRFILWANSIGVDTKAKSLLSALEIGFSNMAEIGGSRKAVVFTESRRTQSYLKEFLESNGYAGKVLTFNGTNREPDTTEIYNGWLETNRNSGRISGSRPVDVRAAIIETFRDSSQVLLATEAAAEGINLQFCSLVVNFDLPWNPQRIEQRIGRCHRYGQKHDVVVINFLNQRNAADCRVSTSCWRKSSACFPEFSVRRMKCWARLSPASISSAAFWRFISNAGRPRPSMPPSPFCRQNWMK